jgi:hypothetical protein
MTGDFLAQEPFCSYTPLKIQRANMDKENG